jgi:hypothetical protein
VTSNVQLQLCILTARLTVLQKRLLQYTMPLAMNCAATPPKLTAGFQSIIVFTSSFTPFLNSLNMEITQ